MKNLLTVLMLVAFIWSAPAHAMPTPIFLPASDNLQATGWRLLTFAGIPATRFEQMTDGAIAVDTMSSSAVLYKRLPEDAEGHILTWRWKVKKGLPPTDQSRKGADDRPLAVHVWFEPRVATSGFFKTMVRAFGFDVPGRVLTYTWGAPAWKAMSSSIRTMRTKVASLSCAEAARPRTCGWTNASISPTTTAEHSVSSRRHRRSSLSRVMPTIFRP